MEAKEREHFTRTWGGVLTQAWNDEAYKSKLFADPTGTLREAGLAIEGTVKLESPPADAGPDLERQIELFEEGKTSGTYLLYVPDLSELETVELSDEELAGVSAGACSSSIISCCCCCA